VTSDFDGHFAPQKLLSKKKPFAQPSLPMASQTQGIQQLLVAEKRAAEKVAEARKRKNRRLKQAKEEAQVSPQTPFFAGDVFVFGIEFFQ
jgi:hypothetical protein